MTRKNPKITYINIQVFCSRACFATRHTFWLQAAGDGVPLRKTYCLALCGFRKLHRKPFMICMRIKYKSNKIIALILFQNQPALVG